MYYPIFKNTENHENCIFTVLIIRYFSPPKNFGILLLYSFLIKLYTNITNFVTYLKFTPFILYLKKY